MNATGFCTAGFWAADGSDSAEVGGAVSAGVVVIGAGLAAAGVDRAGRPAAGAGAATAEVAGDAGGAVPPPRVSTAARTPTATTPTASSTIRRMRRRPAPPGRPAGSLGPAVGCGAVTTGGTAAAVATCSGASDDACSGAERVSRNATAVRPPGAATVA